MNDAEMRHDTDGHRSLGPWLNEPVRLALPRYWLLLGACAAAALVFVALD